MRQTLSEYDDRHDGLGLVGEERADEYARPDRRLPTILLGVLAMALFAGGLWFAYVQGTRNPAAGVARTGDGVPLLRADERPTKVKPDQPGGMAVPDQNVSLYSDKPGGAQVEKLLPAAEQPMPRPAPAAKAAATSLSPAVPSVAPPATPPAPQTTLSASPPAVLASPPQPAPPPATRSAGPKVAPQPTPQPTPTAKAAPPPKQPAPAQAAAAPAGKASPIQVRLASLRSPEAARDEWARMKRENPDLLGKLTAVAVRADLGDQGIYYRIQAGSFGDKADAEKLCGELKRRKLGCILAR